MKLVTFVAENEAQQIGVLMEEEQTIGVLQAGAVAMNGVPSAFFADMLSYLRGGNEARDKALAVMKYIAAHSPPNSRVDRERVKLLAPVPLPDLSRTYFEVGKNLLEPNSKYKGLDGITAEAYL